MKKKNNLIETFLIIIVLLFVFTVIFWMKKPDGSYISAKTIFTEDLESSITEIVCPLNEKKPVITERDTMEKVFRLLRSVNLRPADDEYIMGYYMIEMNTGNDMIFLGVSNSEFVINKKHYKTDKDISDELYTLLFDNVPD